MSSTARHRAAADRLHAAAIHLLRGVRRVDAAMGLGPAKSSALSVLVFGGPRSAGALAAAEGVKPPSLTRVIRELEADGLVLRRPDPRDGRAVTLEATAKARRTLEAGRARRTALLAEWITALGDADLRALEAALPILEGIGGQRAKGRGQRAEGRGQRAEVEGERAKGAQSPTPSPLGGL